MSKLDAKLKQHIEAQLQDGRPIQLMSESRRNGVQGWISRDQLHADETAREERLRSILPSGDQLLIVALNPDSGTFGLFEVPKPEPELDFENGGQNAADARENARRLAEQHSQIIGRAAAATQQSVKAINSGKIKYFEELTQEKPTDVQLDMLLSMLSQIRKSSLHLDTLKGSIQLGGQDGFRKTLPCQKIYRVSADVRAIDDDGVPNGTLALKIYKLHDSVDGPPILKSSKRITAYLKTENDAKALALLHFAKFQGSMLELSLQLEYQISNKHWEIKVVEILNENDLIGQSRPVQAVFSEW